MGREKDAFIIRGHHLDHFNDYLSLGYDEFDNILSAFKSYRRHKFVTEIRKDIAND